MAVGSDVARACPKCHVTTDQVHCKTAGCDWWVCVLCRIMFNRAGVTSQMPSAGNK